MSKATKEKSRAKGVSHPVSVTFSKKEAEQVKWAARETGRSVSGLIRFAAMEYLKKINNAALGVSHL